MEEENSIIIESIEQPFIAPIKPKKVKVKLLNHHVYDGKYIVETSDSQFYLVPKEHLEFSLLEQKISEDLLTEKPQDLTALINIPNITQVLRRLYTDGVFTATEIDFKWNVKGRNR